MTPSLTPSAVRDAASAAGDAIALPGARVRNQLLEARNSDGGWAYRRGNRSRIEPTCWALLGLEEQDADPRVLAAWPRRNSWLVDVPDAPENYAFNALAALTLLKHQGMRKDVGALVRNVISVKGKLLPNSPSLRQDNSIQAWSWVSDTASWVEPTAWSLLLLKKARRHEPVNGMEERIAAGEAMLIDRVCRQGGWNYGNTNVLGTDLWPYVPTTALGLLAMQDRRDHPVVQRSLEQMQVDIATERSPLALALALIVANVFRMPSDDLRRQIASVVDAPGSPAPSILSAAILLTATSPTAWTSLQL